jgi:hypothetical protein
MLVEGLYASITELAAAERIERGYAGQVLRLTLLAPDIVEAALDGSHRGPDLPRLMDPWPSEWEAQRAALGGEESGNSDRTGGAR